MNSRENMKEKSYFYKNGLYLNKMIEKTMSMGDCGTKIMTQNHLYPMDEKKR